MSTNYFHIFIPVLALAIFLNSVNTYSRTIEPNTDINTSNETCKFCHVLTNIVEHEVDLGNKTISDITSVIDDICHIIGGPQGKECIYIVENIKNIVNNISNHMNTTEICHNLGLC